MQLMICFTVSILLAVAVTGLPTGWELYLKNYRPHPPYDPPDIGPPSIDLKFFDHFPGITDWQKAYFKQVYQSAYSDLVRFSFFLLSLNATECLGLRRDGTDSPADAIRFR